MTSGATEHCAWKYNLTEGEARNETDALVSLSNAISR